MQPLDFLQLVEQRLAALEARLQQVDLRLTDEVKKAVSIAQVDLPFALAKARYYMLFDLRDKLVPIGRLDLLDGVAKKGGEYFEKLPSGEASKESESNQAFVLGGLTILSSRENKAGNTRAALGTLAEALTIARNLYAKQQDDANRQLPARILGSHSFCLLFDRQFKEAIAAAEEALALDPNHITPATNQAHGYLLSGQFEKAKAIYRQHARDKINDQQTFAEAVLDDFAKLRQRGIDQPDMKKIEAMLHTKPQ